MRDTPTHDTEQFDKVLWRYNNNLSSYGPDKVGRTDARTDARTHAQTLKKIVATMSRETASGLDKNGV